MGTKEMATDYVCRSCDAVTVGELLEFLRSQPDGAGEVKSYGSRAKKLEMLKNELERYFAVPESTPSGLEKAMAKYRRTLKEVLDKLDKEKSLKAGDTVRLRSGGPLMTVVLLVGDAVRCAWFQGKENREGSFPAAALDREEPAWRRKE